MNLYLGSDISCEYNLKMSDLTTFKIGGIAKNVYIPKNTQEVARLVSAFKNGTKYFVLGNGSNVLMPDGEIPFPVILIGDRMQNFEIGEDGNIAVEAGMLLNSLVQKACEHSLTGLEFAHCIPGTVGGAVFMNAGAFNGEMKDVVRWVEIVDADGRISVEYPDEAFFSYRYSKAQKMGWIITKVGITLKKGDPDAIRGLMREIEEKRYQRQPLEYPSAGSVFKRPPGNFAGKLIDEAGLKGFQIGGARVSEKHAGFIVNVDHATYTDVVRLMDHIVEVVRKNSGIVLEPEVMILKPESKIHTK